jgi:hypothetical protein
MVSRRILPFDKANIPAKDVPFPSVIATKEPKQFPTIEASQINLDGIDSYAPRLRWDTNKGEPANDILDARLRAKYYGAQVITYRPFVLKILEGSAMNAGEQISGVYKPNIPGVPNFQSVTQLGDIDPKVIVYAKNGLKALIHSTRAFHGLGDPSKDRLIVTNVWGTAHA